MMPKSISSRRVLSGGTAQDRKYSIERSRNGSLRITLAALMTSTALVGFLPSPVLAADKVVNGTTEQVTTSETADTVTVGKTLPNSNLNVVSGGGLTADKVVVGYANHSAGTLTISGVEPLPPPTLPARLLPLRRARRAR